MAYFVFVWVLLLVVVVVCGGGFDFLVWMVFFMCMYVWYINIVHMCVYI